MPDIAPRRRTQPPQPHIVYQALIDPTGSGTEA